VDLEFLEKIRNKDEKTLIKKEEIEYIKGIKSSSVIK